MTDAQYPPKLKELLDELKFIEEPELRADLLIEYGERFRDVPERIATRPYPEENRVPACLSDSFLFTEATDNNSLKFYFAVENPQGISAMALAVIIDETLSGAPLEQIAAVQEDIVYEIFGREISMGKGQGLMGMVQMTRAFARNKLKSS